MKKTFVKQTEINSGGGIRISVYKQFYEDDRLIFEEPHLITIGPLDDVEMIIEANNTHLAAMGYPPIAESELALPVALRATAFANPDVASSIAALREQVEQQREEEAARAESERIAQENADAEAAAARERQAKEFQAAIDDAVAKALAAQRD